MNDSVDARVSKYKGTGEFLFMKHDDQTITSQENNHSTTMSTNTHGLFNL